MGAAGAERATAEIRLAADRRAASARGRAGGPPGSRRLSVRVLYVNHTGRVSGGEHSLIDPAGEPLRGDRAHRRLPTGRARGAAAARSASSRVRSRGPMAACGCTRCERLGRCWRWRGPAAQVRRSRGPRDAELVHANSIRAGLVATVAPAAGRADRRPRPRLPSRRSRCRALTLRGDRPCRRADRQLRPHPRPASAPSATRSTSSTTPSNVARFAIRRSAGGRPCPARPDAGAAGAGVIAQITPWKGQDDAIRCSRRSSQRDHPGVHAAAGRVGEVRQRRDPLRQPRLPRSLRARLTARARRLGPVPRRARRHAGDPRAATCCSAPPGRSRSGAR